MASKAVPGCVVASAILAALAASVGAQPYGGGNYYGPGAPGSYPYGGYGSS